PLFRSHFLRYGFIGNYFWYHPQIHFDRIWSCEGQINTCVLPTSHPGYALCSSVYRAGIPCKNGIASYTAKRHQLVYLQASIGVNWAVNGICKVFASILGSFGIELRIAALTASVAHLR